MRTVRWCREAVQGYSKIRLNQINGSLVGCATVLETHLQIIKPLRLRLVGLFGVLLMLIAACSPAATTVVSPTLIPTSSETAAEPGVAPTQTNTPTETPAPGRVILIAPEGSYLDLQALLEELSQKDGLVFSLSPSINEGEIGPEVRLVVAVQPDPGLTALAASAPGTQFLAMGFSGIEPGENISVVAGPGQRMDQIGFLAGYIAAAITPHWRVGVLSSADTTAGKSGKNGFSNGVVYYCGLCRPAYPPYVQYPIAVEVAASASLSEQQAAVDVLLTQAVNTVFLMGELANPELVDYLASKDMRIISDAPPPSGREANWVATIQTDTLNAVSDLWPGIIAGQGGEHAEIQLNLGDINTAFLSPGRQGHIEEILVELNDGVIDTGVDLSSGEPRP